MRNLIDAHPESPYPDCPDDLRLGVARAVAQAAGHSFLIQHSALALARGAVDDRPVVVTCGRDGMVQVRDLGTGRLLGRPMTGHGKAAHAVRCGTLDGRPVAVTCSLDDTVRIWDLASCAPVGVLHVPGVSQAVLLTDTGDLACAFGSDVAVFTANERARR